jgi:hypothetical protein
MPAVSEKQKRFMDAAAHNPQFAKAAGIPISVAKEFSSASKGQKFGSGGPQTRADVQSVNKSKTNHGEMSVMKGGGMATKKMFGGKESYKEELAEGKALRSGKITPQQYARGEKSEGEMGMKKMASGGITSAKMGAVKSGGFKGKGEHAIQSKGISKGTMVKMGASKPLGMKKGGMTKKMAYGGKC